MFARFKIRSIRVQFWLAFFLVLFLAAVLTVVIDTRNSSNNQAHLKKIKDRIALSQMQSNLRKHVEFSIQDFNLFIINPITRFRKDYYQHISKAIELGSKMAKFNETQLESKFIGISALNQFLLKNKNDVKELFSIRTDPLKLYPSMSLANGDMFEFNVAILSVLESAIVETKESDPVDLQLLLLLNKAKDSWRRTINLYRLYLINRIGTLFESELSIQVTGVIDSYKSYKIYVDKITKYKSGIELGLETSEVAPILNQRSENWYTRFIEVSKINLREDWRGDISVLNDRIYPNILKIFSILNSIDTYLLEASVSDLKKQEMNFSENSQVLWGLVSLLLTIIAISYYILNRSILNPLLELSKYFRNENEHEFGYHKINANNIEMNNFVKAFEYMQEQVSSQQVELEQRAMHDPLTDLPNRFYLSKIINERILNFKLDPKKFAIFLLDLNNFKDINDSLGHNIGDEALCDVAERLIGCLRSSDFIARIGGDEFAMVVSDATEQKLKIIARQIHRSLESDYCVANHYFSIGVSIGIAIYPDHAELEKDLLKCADIAMYRAKRSREEFNLYRKFRKTTKHNTSSLLEYEH